MRKRKIYLYKKIIADKWEEFESSLNTLLDPQVTYLLKISTTDIDKVWNIWAAKIKEAMNTHIPFTFTALKHFYALSLKATKLYAALKNINRYINYLSSDPIGDITDANYCL